ncbi:MAG: FkbM family methyltransferase [Ignavibacteriaceae bacterium]
MKLKNILPSGLYNYTVKFYDRYFNSFANKSYSQEAEDLILQRIFEYQKTGFYIDVGAHHPKRFSNTYLFYKKGWRGINIEPRPGSKKYFDKIRSRDINIEAAISEKIQKLTYYMFNEPALNKLSDESEIEILKNENHELKNKIEVETTTLKNICDKYLSDNVQIDFLSVDAEGYDLNVLSSNDWDKYRPKIVLAEDKDFELEAPFESSIFKFMSEKGYKLFAKTYYTLIFKNSML